MPLSAAMRSRRAYMARNFHVVSTCSRGKGGGAGWKALRARCSRAAESLPIEYSSTGRAHSAATSRRMWMLSLSSLWRCVSRSAEKWGATASGQRQPDLAVQVAQARLIGGGRELAGLDQAARLQVE